MAVPSRSLKNQLQQAGLGRKKICFNSKANATEVKTKLEESYPKLIAGGGFEILRRGPSPSELSVIPPPNSGYTVHFLRDCAGLGQAIAYVRPVQRNLNQDPVEAVLEDCKDSGDVPKVACINCSLEIPVTHVRQHLDVCCKDDELSDSGCTLEAKATVPISDDEGEETMCSLAVTCTSMCTDDVSLESSSCASASNGSIHESSNSEENLKRLNVLFPSLEDSKLFAALETFGGDVNATADFLLQERGASSDSGISGESALVTPSTDSADLDDKDLLESPFCAKTVHAPHGLPADRILKIFKEDVITDGPSMPITFNRSKNPFRELCRIYKNSANKLVRPPVVYFVSDSGEEDLLEEEAADIGGPLREFLTIALETLSKGTAPQLFEGDDDHKLPVHSQQLLLNGYFKMMGEIVAHAIIHGDVWFAGLAKAVKVYLSTGCTETAAQVVCTEDVPDLNVRKVLQRMSQAGEDEVASLNSEDIVSNLLDESGVSASFVTINNAAQVAYEIMVHQVIHKRLRELDEIRKGLNVLHIGTLLTDHPKVTSLVFPTVDEVAVDLHVLLARVKKDPTSCQSEKSDTAFGYFHEYLQNVCKRKVGTGIKSILAFITGTPLMPKEVIVGFLPDEKGYSLPDPDTCACSLKIPTCFSTYGQFEAAFDATVRIQGKGYGRA